MEEEVIVSVTTEPGPSPFHVLVAHWHADWFTNAAIPTDLQNRIADAVRDLVKRLDAAKE